MQVGTGNNYVVINNGDKGLTGYGEDFTWGTWKITPLSSLSQTSGKPYMRYDDNPAAPAVEFLVRPVDDGRFPRQLQPLVQHRRRRLLALLLVARNVPRSALVCLQARGPRRHWETPRKTIPMT